MYRNLLLPIECDDLDLTGYKVDSHEMKIAKKTKDFELDWKNGIKVGTDAILNTFYFKKYIKASKHYSPVPSLLIHLRDAFAHNRINKDILNGCITLENVDKGGQPTMYARVVSFDKLIDIVEAIKRTKGAHLKK